MTLLDSAKTTIKRSFFLNKSKYFIHYILASFTLVGISFIADSPPLEYVRAG